MDEGGSPGTPVNLVCIGTFFPCAFLLVGGGGGVFLTRGLAAKPRAEQWPSVVHSEEERIHESAKFKFFCHLSRPFEAMAQYLELN